MAYAYDHSAYYRRRFKEAGINRDLLPTLPLTTFPTMDKHDSILTQMHKQMKRLLADKHLEWVEFRLRFVQEIPPDSHTGKKKLIVRQTA